jgi:23S rRNA (guanosine2251-2'-O)-methyltransferase
VKNIAKNRNQRPAAEKHKRPSRKAETPVRAASDDIAPRVIYGLLPVLEALRARSRRIERVIIAAGSNERRVAEITELCRTGSIPWSFAPRDAIQRLVPKGETSQGVVAVVSAASYVELEDIIGSRTGKELLVVLDGVEDPRNLGAVLRVAECVGADGVIIPDRRAVGLTEAAAKSSAGAVEYVKVAKVKNLNRAIEALKERGVWVVGTSPDATMNYTDWDWNQPSALVLGGEGHGLHRLVAENCDVLVRIPMYGKIDSLNLSVAAGVILFEARRQRENKSG